MHTKQTLLTHLSKLNINPKGTLMVHISCKAVGEVEGRGETILDALSEYMSKGLLVLPAHTWMVNSNNPVTDILYSKTCVGILTEMFRHRPNVHRSLHPTHSLCALGEGAEEFLSGEELILFPCGKHGAYYKLWERDAQILLIGVNFTRNTIIHGFEEWDGAEGSISKEKTDLYVINNEGRRIYTPQYRHCSPNGSETFSKLEPYAYEQNILKIGKFGDATARVMNAKPLRKLVARFLKEDKEYLLRY